MTKYVDITDEELIEKFRQGKTVAEICEIYTISRSCVQRRFKKLNLSVIKICPKCGEKFQTSNNSKIYCSIKCVSKVTRDKWVANHPLRNKLLGLKTRIKLRKRLIQKLGGKCSRCGIEDWRVLQINHINGGGHKERISKGSKKTYKEILNGERDGEFSLLCANCNILYEYEMGRRKDESSLRGV